ncbi:MAG: LPS assembly protein LptD [Rubrivivax sp.]
MPHPAVRPKPLVRLLPVAAALAAWGPALAQTRTPAPAAADQPVQLQAREIRGRPDLEATAEGDVELRRGPLTLQADWMSYEQARDLAIARGQVRVRNDTGRYSGTELQLQLQRFEGFFVEPTYEFDRVKAGGRAARIDFLGERRSVAQGGWYTSCPREGLDAAAVGPGGERPAWVLKTDRVHLDFERNEGVAEGAVLRFMDVPILALPTLSFPLGEGRKSGWLPPTVDFDTRSGPSLAVPYYLNLAPHHDATLTPRVITRRGFGGDAEFRYLEPGYRGRVQLDALPYDRLAGRSRWALWAEHEGALPLDARWQAQGLRVSDDAWWKDFPRDNRSVDPRLLPLRVQAERDLAFGDLRGLGYARLLRWQVLQGSDVPVVSPYERAPQLGLQFAGPVGGGFQVSLQTELNRFVRPDREGTAAEPTGWRAHALGELSWPWRSPGVWVVPRVSVNAARYDLDQALVDGRRQAARTVPSFSVEAGMAFERETTLLGQRIRQTLEPRALYVRTPFRDQTGLPNFDSAGKDFNFNSIFSDNAFSGVDRVSDAHQVTAGVTTRVLDAASGGEALRLGVVQRYLLRTQQITPEGTPFTQRFSDLFLLGSAALGAHVGVEGALQYSPDIQRPMRTIASARWNPGEFRTLSATYRYSRSLTEQLELGWQWPVWKRGGGAAAAAPARGGSGSSCGGTWYAVGRVNYSMRDSRLTDSVLGLEYDAGCWILRVVGERLSTGRSEATTHILVQLELVGLSRLGSNPLRVLKDNIPGYRLLRDERSETIPPPPRYD